MNFDFSTVKNYLDPDSFTVCQTFLSIVQTPKFMDEFQRLFLKNSEWAKRSTNEQVFFLVEDFRWRNPLQKQNSIYLKFIGFDQKLVIVINLYNNY